MTTAVAAPVVRGGSVRVVDPEGREWHVESPFDGWFEMSTVTAAIGGQYGRAIVEPINAAQQHWTKMVDDLLSALYPDAVCRRVPKALVREHGWDSDAPGPDPRDYW